MPCWSQNHADSISRGVHRYWNNLLPEQKKIKTANFNKWRPGHIHAEKTDSIIQRICEARAGGFWYGNIIYHDDLKHSREYCELWNEDLKERIRAYWGYVSALSGKSEVSSRSKNGIINSISCHHIYYQKKACCIWDEDERGYYANINIGTLHNPNIVRHYIDGDPNKFVTLTASEHKATDYNKLHWIETFENLIEDQGGKCYFTKQEIEELLK